MQAYRRSLNDEQRAAQRLKDKLRMRARRAKLKQGKSVNRITNRKPVSKTTATRRIDTIDRLRRGMGIRGPASLAYLHDYRGVLGFIEQKYTNTNSKLTIASHIVGHLKQLTEGFPLRQYRSYMKIQNDARMHSYRTNRKSLQDARNWVSWDEIAASRTKVVDPLQQAVMDLYLENMPRHSEYRELRVVHTDTSTNIEEIIVHGKGNYLVLGQFPTMVLNRYKGSGKKGVYMLSAVPASLLRLAERTTHMQYLFTPSQRSASGWSKLVGDTFEEHTNKRVGINILRKSYVSWRFQRDPHMSEATKADMATQMGTSVGKLMLVYRKID